MVYKTPLPPLRGPPSPYRGRISRIGRLLLLPYGSRPECAAFGGSTSSTASRSPFPLQGKDSRSVPRRQHLFHRFAVPLPLTGEGFSFRTERLLLLLYGSRPECAAFGGNTSSTASRSPFPLQGKDFPFRIGRLLLLLCGSRPECAAFGGSTSSTASRSPFPLQGKDFPYRKAAASSVRLSSGMRRLRRQHLFHRFAVPLPLTGEGFPVSEGCCFFCTALVRNAPPSAAAPSLMNGTRSAPRRR